MAEDLDIIVIGGGPGGYTAALHAAHLGARVALVERDRVGGTCLNRGCIPTKAMVQDAELYQQLASGAFGAAAEGGVALDYGRLLARRDRVVETLVSGVESLLERHRVRRVAGSGRLLADRRVEVTRADGETEVLAARAVILATGSEPAAPPIAGADLPGVVTSDGLLALTERPERLLVVGGSTVGTEFASLYAALGSQVEIVELLEFLPAADPALAKRYRALLRQRGVNVSTNTGVQEITRTPEGDLQVRSVARGRGGREEEQVARADVVLLATGRRPVTRGLGLEEAGVALEGRAVKVNARLETSVPGVYAVGDVTGGWQLAHVASYQAEVAVDNILGRPREADYAVVPSCIYTLPEIAGVGLTEDEAKARGLEVKVTRFPFHANGRALALGETEGQVRLTCEAGPDGRGGRVLGVHIMGPRASDIIAEAALAIRLGATAEDLARTMHQHPTLPEALMEAAMAQGDGAIHYG